MSTFGMLMAHQASLRTLRGRVPVDPAPSTLWYGLIPFGQDNGAVANRHYTIPHAPALDGVAATGYSLGCFTRLSQNAGVESQYILSSGERNANPSFSWYWTEASASTPSAYNADVSDADSDHPGGSTDPDVTLDQTRLVIVQYNPSTGNLEQWLCTPGQAAEMIASAAGPDGNVVAPTDWNFGRRSDADPDRYNQESLGGLFKVDRPLTSDEIAELATGVSPVELLGSDCAGAWAFKDGAQTTEPDLTANGNDATRVGTGWDETGSGSAALVARWDLDETSGSTAADDIGTPANGTIAGASYEDGSLVTGDAGRMLGFSGGAGVGIDIANAGKLAVAEPNIVLWAQMRTAPGAKQTLLGRDRGSGANGGGCTVQIIDDDGTPRWFVYRRTEAGSPVLLGAVDGFGTVPAAGTAFRIALLTNATDGTTFMVDDTVVATNPTLTAGWLDNTLELALGAYRTGSGLVDALNGFIDRVELWSGRLTVADVQAMPAAQDYEPDPGGTGDIELTAIDAYAVDADSGGTIASASGGTMPATTIDYDPTDHVSGAAGSKSAWSAEFRNVTLGAWTRLAGGDFRFTPGSSTGNSTGEYRVSDDAGVTWSPWQDIAIEVVARPPGPFYLAEDYGGVSGQKVQNAINDCSNDGGGTVTTLDQPRFRPDIEPDDPWIAKDVIRSDGSNGYTWQENVHLLGLWLKQPNATRNGQECSVSGNGQCSGWVPSFWDDLIRGGTAWGASWGTALRQQAVLCDFDGNAIKMAYHSTAGDQPTPNSNCGTCCKPGGGSGDTFNLQQQSGLRLRGTSDGNAANRRKARFKRCRVRRTMGDGRNNVGGFDIEDEDVIYEDTGTRGGPNMIGGNSKQSMVRVIVRNGPDGFGAKVDHETETFGSRNVTLIHTDCKLGPGLFDMIARSSTSGGSSYLIEGTEIGPGLNLLARLATNITVTFRGTGNNPQGLIRYHVQGGGGGGTHPACRIGGWAGQSPHICTYHFEDQVFEAFGDQYIFNTVLHTPGADDFVIRIGDSVNTGDAFRIEVENCIVRWRNRPSGATGRLFQTTKSLTTQQVVRIDGLTIATGFERDAIRLDGQRLEYRNVVHQGFPSATIQQVCPGAGQYVAI